VRGRIKPPKPCKMREVMKAIAARSVTFRPDGLPPNAAPIALMTPCRSVTNLNRCAGSGADFDCFCSRFEDLRAAGLIGFKETTKFEIHRNKSTDKNPVMKTRSIFRTSFSELRQSLSDKIQGLIFLEVIGLY